MKKQLFLLLMFACSLVAKAQFANPFEYDNGKGITYEAHVFAMTDANPDVIVPQDTIIEANKLGFTAVGSYIYKEQQGNDYFYGYTFNGQVKDYYKRDMGPNPEFGVVLDFANAESEGQLVEAFTIVSTDLGGHFYWEWKDSIEGFTQNGHVQLNMQPLSIITGKNGNSEEKLYEYRQLDIYSKIRTGFPYDIANYQGVTKYTVYAPDSSIVCTKEIALRMSADSIMNGQIQEDFVCSVDSARKGTYRVIMDAPFLEKPQVWQIEVIDPFVNATSHDPVDATYRLRESDFKNEGKGNGWNYTGNKTPTYFNGKVNNNNGTAMVVRTQGDEGNAFSLSQTVNKMPQGYYKLTWPVIYQPCNLAKMEGNEPILAEIEANGFSVKAKHILAGAQVTEPKNGEEGIVALAIPQSDKAFASRLNYQKYQNEITFQVKEDSVINISMHKSHTTLDNEITAIGGVTLKYYGAGLPYGGVTFYRDSLYAAGDSIKMTVTLGDGLGKKVPSSNTIEAYVLKQKEDGNYDAENPVIIKQMAAAKEGSYDMFIELPEGDTQLPNGNYLLLVRSLKEEGDYLLLDSKIFDINNSTAINEITADPTDNAAKGNADKNIYNIAGMKLSNSRQTKGIYIKGKKKYVRARR